MAHLAIVAAIEWTYVGSLGGDLIENFAATCLRQRYSNALQTKPASGDGGIDVYRKTPDGLVVWQIKKFVAPLSPGQKQQVIKSWKRFWKTHVEAGEKISQYFLATPWTPTDSARDWFDELTIDASFPTQWDGESFFNGLASDFPATADRFFKGPDMLESMVNAKALLASSPVETTSEGSMLDAVARREAALREIRDLASDNYFINSGTRSSMTGDPPLPGPDEAGVVHRYTYIGDNRFQIESVVPKNAQAVDVDPITLNVRFKVPAGSEEEKRIRDWIDWGVPFKDIPGEIQQRGGPLSDIAPHDGMLSFVAVSKDSFPDLKMELVTSAGIVKHIFTLGAVEVTNGATGGGLRVVAQSPARIFQLEIRTGSERVGDSLDMKILDSDGLDPAAVRDDLTAILGIQPSDEFRILVKGVMLVSGSGFGGAAELTNLTQSIAEDLTELQRHARDTFVMPSVQDVTVQQMDDLKELADIYRGNPRVSEWDRISIVVNDPTELERTVFSGTGQVVCVSAPVFRLGEREYALGRRVAQTIHSVSPAPGTVLAEVEPGDEIELVPGTDNRITTAAIVDDEL